jgi:predicted ATPase
VILRSARIRHYKSLDDTTIEFAQPVTVIVGPNAVGKSNLVDCLRFVRDAVASDLEHAIGLRGGLTRVRQWSRTKPFKISIGLEFEQSFDSLAPEPASYEFTIQSQTGGAYVVEHERAVCGEEVSVQASHDEAPFQAIDDAGFVRDKSGKVTRNDRRLHEKPLRPDQLAIGVSPFFENLGDPIASFIKEWRFSSIYPNTLRQPESLDKDTELSEDGRNWASVLKAMRRSQRGKAALEKAFEAMRSLIPSFRDVSVATAGSFLVPLFRFQAGDQVNEFDPVQLSDGTLRVFGILLALYQTPAPGLLIIEEPEQTVHPGALGVLVDAIREASETTQIVLTTHSPHLVDHFEPEEIRVVSLEDGLTKVSPIKATQMEAVKQRLMSLEEFMLAEGLQPQAS